VTARTIPFFAREALSRAFEPADPLCRTTLFVRRARIELS